MMYYFHHFKTTLFVFATFIFSTAAWSQYGDRLSGTWYHNGQATQIRMTSFNQYLFCNENRDCARGVMMNNRDINVLTWSVTGRVNNQYRTIRWSNGTEWSRYSTSRADVDGQWFHNGQPTQIHVDIDGNRFFLTNEFGQSNGGYIRGNTLTLATLNLIGYVSLDGSRIRWSNNTVWTRYPG